MRHDEGVRSGDTSPYHATICTHQHWAQEQHKRLSLLPPGQLVLNTACVIVPRPTQRSKPVPPEPMPRGQKHPCGRMPSTWSDARSLHIFSRRGRETTCSVYQHNERARRERRLRGQAPRRLLTGVAEPATEPHLPCCDNPGGRRRCEREWKPLTLQEGHECANGQRCRRHQCPVRCCVVVAHGSSRVSSTVSRACCLGWEVAHEPA